jgi:hypothetical protein
VELSGYPFNIYSISPNTKTTALEKTSIHFRFKTR